ncbi:MAG: coproporphyrinogen dehydrogenase HemZ [Lachnospiraceae bacterium]|nr:coproporphyrinogen dehydrogenase HemZ [Lachnospiraceae bacterium]
MIVIRLNEQQFEYDIHSLVKAFYPAEEVKVFEKETRDFSSAEGMPEGQVIFEEEKITFILETKKEKNKEAETLREDNDKIVEFVYLEKGEERASVKCKLKHLLYSVLCTYTKRELPWGNLTGIRPTKIAYGLLEEGKNHEEAVVYLQEVYDCSEEKALLSIDIAERERQILSKLHYEDGYSLYLGIPFCPTTCLYCSFTSYPIGLWKKRVGEYLDAMEKEIDFVSELYKDKILDTVYIGGGTPTTLEPEELRRLLSYVREKFDFSTVCEFTVEAGRADSITREKLLVLKEMGVTRISVNPQTMKEETLKIIGRRHTVEEVKEAFALAREVGFTNINMDLILGLPGETMEDVTNTMEEIKMLNPDSLTVHSLAIKRASKMNQWIEENGIETLRNTEKTMEIADKAARAINMKPYYLYRQKNMAGNLENVGYATEGNYGIYNILIMEEKQTIVAIGAGTISKRVYPDGRIERCDNVKDVEQYMDRIQEMIERKRKLYEE